MSKTLKTQTFQSWALWRLCMPGMHIQECSAAHTGVLKEINKNSPGSMSDDTISKRRHHVQMDYAESQAQH